MGRIGLIKLICALMIVVALSATGITAVVLGKAIIAEAENNDSSFLEKTPLVISSGDASATYNGMPLTANSWQIKSGELKAGHKIFVTVTGSQMGAGISENHFNVVIKDSSGKDVTGQYNIEKQPGALNVRARSLTIKAGDASKSYDGTPLTTNDYTLKSPLLTGDIISNIVIDGSITEVGNTKSYVKEVSISNSLGEDVTKNYNIKTEEGHLVVYPPNAIIIKTAGTEKQYDGTPLVRDEWYLEEEVELAPGHELVVKVTGSITEPGNAHNTFEAKVIDSESGEDVSYNYTIAKDERNLGILTVKKREVTVISDSDSKQYDGTPLTNDRYYVVPDKGELGLDITYEFKVVGTQTEIGKSTNTIDDEYKFFYKGEEVTDFFVVKKMEGVLEVTEEEIEKIPLEFEMKDRSKAFDGTPLEADPADCVLKSGKLKPGHVAKATVSGSRTEFGTSESKIVSIVILDGEEDVSRYYDIKKTPGDLTITKLALKITSGSAEKGYDGTPLTCPEIDVEILSSGVDESVFENFKFECEATGTITDPGSALNTIVYSIKYFSGEDIDPKNFEIKTQLGNLEVFEAEDEEREKPVLTYRTDSESKTYDGSALDEYGWERLSGELLDGHTEHVKCISSITDVGTIEALLEIVIKDSEGNDVTDQYEIKHEGKNVGTLTVNKRQITLSASDATKEYDGTPLYATEYTIEGELAPGQSLEVILSGSQTDANDMSSVPTYAVIDSFKIIDDATGLEVDLSNYDIPVPGLGELVVTQRPISVYVTDKSKFYDGTPLTSTDYTSSKTGGAGEKALVLDHYFEFVIEGTITDPDTVDNVITDYHVFSGEGVEKTDVTHNYLFTIKNGKLTVIGVSDEEDNFEDEDQSDDIGIGGGSDSNKLIFRVTTKKADIIYLRSKSYGLYLKNGWRAAPAYEGTYINSAYAESPYFATAYGVTNSTGASYLSECKIDSYAEIFVTPYYVWGEVAAASNDVESIGLLSSISQFFPYVDWEWSSGTALVFPQSASAAMQEYENYVKDEGSPYLAIDDESRAFFEDFIRENGINPRSSTLISDVANLIKRSARYNLDYNKELDEEANIAVAFLTDKYKEGICQHYASAATLLYRTLGIPARYTTGFAVQTSAGKETDVLAKMAHAWVEVYIDQVGWVNVEVTGSGSPAMGEDVVSIGVTPSAVSVKASATPDGIDPDDKINISGFDKLSSAGYRYEVVVKAKGSADGKFRGLGRSQSVVSLFRIYDNFDYLVYEYVDGEVTLGGERFTVAYKEGSIHRYISELYFSSESINGFKKTYDGEAIDFEAVFTSGELVEGELITSLDENGDYKFIITTSEMINCCTGEKAEYSVKVMKAVIGPSGNKIYSQDVTDRYKIEKKYGLVTINKLEIDVTAPSAEMVYTGGALVSNDYHDLIIDATKPLANGDYIASAVIYGEQIKIGDSDNRLMSVTIMNAKGQNVSGNYIINLHDGRLVVTAP